MGGHEGQASGSGGEGGGGMTSRCFYKHGLYAASHPRIVLVFCVAVLFSCCFPLFTYIPILSHRPKIILDNDTSSLDGTKPLAYVQQVVMKAMVHPYHKDQLVMTDAFRGPLASAFKLHLDHLAAFKDSKR